MIGSESSKESHLTLNAYRLPLKACILILNFNGAELLRKYLPSFQEAVKASKHDCRLAVIDNASSDASPDILKKEFPGIEVHALKTNRVLCAYNEVAAGLNDDVIILMNNDIRAERGFIDPILRPFLEAGDVFFTTPKVFGPSGNYEGNKTRGFVRFGVFGSTAMYEGYEKNIR